MNKNGFSPIKIGKFALLAGFVLFFFTSVNIQAQEEGSSPKKFRFGLTATPSVGWFKSDNQLMEKYGVGMGFSYGLVGDISLGDNYAFSTGLDVSSLAGGLTYTADTIQKIITTINVDSTSTDSVAYLKSTSNYKYKLKYVEIPLMLKMKTKEIGYITYFGTFGFRLGIGYSGLADYDITANDGSSSGQTQYKGVDVANELSILRTTLSLGGGIEYNISGNTSLVCGLTFNQGIMNTFKTVGDDSPRTLSVDTNGDLELSAAGKPVVGAEKKAKLNTFALQVGIIF